MNILITGHKGYIGYNLLRTIETNYSSIGSISLCDIKTGQDFADITGGSYDVVVHLAAYVSILESFWKSSDYIENNCVKIARFIRNNKIGKFIFTSTCAVYGEAVQASEEDSRLEHCKSPYAESKKLAEMLIKQMHDNFAILRLSNVYGGDDAMRVEAAVHHKFANDNPIVVYDGQQTRDFVHVDTVCKAIINAIHKDVKGIYNIGSGVETKVVDLAKWFSDRRGVPVFIEPARDGEIKQSCLNITKAMSVGLL